MVCLRYRRIRFTACQWSLVGRCINWHTRLIANAKSGRVRDKHYSEPTTLRYNVGSSIGLPVKADNVEEDAMGDGTGFASVLLVL